MTQPAPETLEPFHVVERNGWSYVVDPFQVKYGGPWRYRWEAQEYANELNAREPAK